MAFEVARHHELTLDVLVVAKIGAPGHPELAMGAVGEGGVVVRNEQVIAAVGATHAAFEAALEAARTGVEEKAREIRDTGPPDIESRTTVIVDDGVATGASALAAAQVARSMGAGAVWLAVPVAPRNFEAAMRTDYDRVVTVHQPRRFGAVGIWYDDFHQVPLSEVRDILARARLR